MKELNHNVGWYQGLRIGIVVSILIAMCIAPVFGGGQQDSTDSEVMEVRMSYNGPPDAEENAVHFFADNFKRLVAEKTGGKIKLVLYPNSQLGDEEQRMEQVMSDPTINVASYGGVGTVFPELYAAVIPFLFDNYAAGKLFFDESKYWQECQAEFRKRTGAELVECVEEGGFLAFTNSKRPIHKPTDFKGMKFRAMDDSQVALYKSFGASGTPIPWTEVYIALQTGVADGQMNPPMYIIMGSLYEVQDYMTMANIQYSMQFLTINGKWLDSLSGDFQTALKEAAKEANNLTRADVEGRVKERTQFIADKGVEVYYPTDEEMQNFRQIGQPSFIEWLVKKFDKKWVDIALESAEIANLKAGK